MNSRNLALDLMFLSTLSDIDSPEFLLQLTTGVQVGETREGMGQEPLKKVSVHLLFPDSKPHKKNNLLGAYFFPASEFNRAKGTDPFQKRNHYCKLFMEIFNLCLYFFTENSLVLHLVQITKINCIFPFS